ncbi:hypothetical protein HanPSC8_Chr08g0310121 [Helianthus annuus]|nr:hypothetical protein HanPSC8_Chr08g0310121 [Helianthus annuus]
MDESLLNSYNPLKSISQDMEGLQNLVLELLIYYLCAISSKLSFFKAFGIRVMLTIQETTETKLICL